MALTWVESLWVTGGGVIAMACAVYWADDIRIFRRAAFRARGVVVESVESPDRDGSTYAPRFEFTAQDGVAHSVLSALSTRPPSFAVGDVVEVFYLRDNPDHAKIDSFGQLWLGPLAVGLIGIVALVIGIVGMLR